MSKSCIEKKKDTRNRHVIDLLVFDETILCSTEFVPRGVDKNDVNEIRRIIELKYTSFNEKGNTTISELISEEIKKNFGGEWFVFAYNMNLEPKLPFTISSVSKSDILKFRMGESIFQIARIK